MWKEIRPISEKERNESPLQYYTGLRVRTSPCCQVRQGLIFSTRMMLEKREQLRNAIGDMSFSEYKGFAKKLGATHLLISKSPSVRFKEKNILVENSYFAVVPID